MDVVSFTFSREPNTYINLIKGVITLLVVYGVPITKSQQDAIIGLGILVVTFIIGGLAQRALTTPVAAPQLPTGTLVTVTGITPEGEADPVVGL